MQRKQQVVVLAAGCFLWAWGLAGAPAGAQMDHSGHGAMSHEGMSHGAATALAGPAMPEGVVIREAKVQDVTFVYRLYSWAERNAMMKGMEGHSMPGMDTTGKSTNHLMLFVKDAGGKLVSGGKVGFVVAGPDKAEYKTLTMGMFDGYGADVPLGAKGSHTIRTKAVFGDRTLTEDFTYVVK